MTLGIIEDIVDEVVDVAEELLDLNQTDSFDLEEQHIMGIYTQMGRKNVPATALLDPDTQRPYTSAYGDPLLEIAITGKLFGRAAKYYIIKGSRHDGWVSTSEYGDLTEYLDTSQTSENLFTSSDELFIYCASADDTAAGSGLQAVRLVYLNASGILSYKTIPTTGQTYTSIGTGHSKIWWLESAAPTSSTERRVSADRIYITKNGASVAVPNICEMIEAGSGRSLSASITIPSDSIGLMANWRVSSDNSTMDCKIRADFFSDSNELSQGLFHFIDEMHLKNNETSPVMPLGYKFVPSGTTVKISAKPGAAAATNDLNGSFGIIIMAAS